MLLVALAVIGAPGALLSALPVMLALGVLHSDVSARVPALGYWATVLVLWGLTVFVAYIRKPRSASDA